MLSLFGVLTYKRWVFRHEDCHADFSPLDLGLGRVRRVTGGVASLVCHYVADLPPRRAQKNLERDFGLRMSPGAVEDIGKEIGERLRNKRKLREEQYLEPVSPDRPAPPAEPITEGEVHVTEVDAVKVRFVKEEGGWHDVKVGLSDRMGLTLHPRTGVRRLEGPRRYVAELTDADSFGPRLKALALETGLRQAIEAVFLGDGADWIDKMHREYFSWTERILDAYHVESHLHDMAEAIHGEGVLAAKKMVEKMKDYLYAPGGADKVCAAIRRAIKRRQPAEKNRHTAELVCDYIRRHSKALDYARFRGKNWIIGSGAIEGGGCNTFIEDRFKRAGQCWTKIGFHKILALREASESEQWDRVVYVLRNYPCQKPRKFKQAV